MYLPLHFRGVTLFPGACYVQDCWQPRIDVVTGIGQVMRVKCAGGYPAATIALAYARIEARQFLRAVQEDHG